MGENLDDAEICGNGMVFSKKETKGNNEKKQTERRYKMSVSLWAYEPTICDGYYCEGECDLCSKLDEALAHREEAADDD